MNNVRTIAARETPLRYSHRLRHPGAQGEELADLNELEMAGAVAFSDDGAPVYARRSCAGRCSTGAIFAAPSSTTVKTCLLVRAAR
jgi:hypothetical protein